MPIDSQASNGGKRCIAAAQNKNVVFALRAAAFYFSAFAANGRSQFLPVTAQGRKRQFSFFGSGRSNRKR
jgi:hypothetical protein